VAGDSSAARALLRPALERSADERFAAAAIAFADRDYAAAEGEAADAMHRGSTVDLQCLAAAAAIDQDHPERVEGHLAGGAGDCVTLLRAAALAQGGARGQALVLLESKVSDARYEAGFESAEGLLHLQGGDLEAAAADAKTATDAAEVDPLAAHPYVWLTTPSPRGEGKVSLRVSGPFEDAGIATRILEGDAARDRGSKDLAAKLYQTAADRGGRTALAEIRLGQLMRRQGRPQLARAHLTRALEIDGRSATALVELALVEESEPGMLAQAISHAAAALALEPENRDARRIASRR
jgi:tetratricopeptide (TPR) repeat protein